MTPADAYGLMVAAAGVAATARRVAAEAAEQAEQAERAVDYARYRLALTQTCPRCQAGPDVECHGTTPFLLHGDRYESARQVAAEIEAVTGFRTM